MEVSGKDSGFSHFTGIEGHTKYVFQGPGAKRQTTVFPYSQLCTVKDQNGLG